MKPNLTIARILMAATTIITLGSCSTYLVSPLNTNSNPHIPLPMKAKDEENITDRYVGIGVSPGTNLSEDIEGDVYNFGTLRFVQSHALGSFRVGYGANLMLGSYLFSASQTGGGQLDDAYRDANAGTRFFGALGINTRMSFTTVSRDGKKEWRYLGLEGSLHREFGDMLTTRKSFPEASDYYVDRRDWYYTAGIFTEAVFRKKNDKYFGFKFGLSLRTIPRMFVVLDPYKDDNDNRDKLPSLPDYFNATFMFGKQHAHMFVQPVFGAANFGVQLGFLYKFYK